MGSITPLLNKWNGKHFQSYSVKCDICGKVGHVIIFRSKHGSMRICENCTQEGKESLSEMILKDATK